jgi:magnesium transporter
MYPIQHEARLIHQCSVKAILDANRNALMLLELRFSVWTLGLGAGTFLAALYGMNLKNFIEESDFGFWGVSGISAAASVFVLIYGLGRLRRVQRVSMWGDHCAPAHGSRHRALGAGGPQDAVLQALREELRVEEKSGLWGLGFGRSATQMDRIKKLTDKLDKAKEQTMSHHPQGPLWTKAAANRQAVAASKPLVE